MSTKEGKQIREIKVKYLPEKGNEYGTNHFFQVLDITTPLQELFELKDMKIPIWQYSGKHSFGN